MKTVGYFGRTVAGTFLVVIAGALAGMLVPLKVPAVQHVFAWSLASIFVSIAALGAAALRSDWRGLRLGAAIAVIPLVITTVNAIEGAVFLSREMIPWKSLVLHSLITYGLAMPALGFVYSKGRKSDGPHERIAWPRKGIARTWRFAASDLAYVLLYYAAGTVVFPFVREFYATQALPSAGRIIALQLAARGPMFVLICLLLMRMFANPGLKGALAVGLVFTIVSGVAPLLIPNPYFPDAVRWVHFGEVTSSNFLFGAFVAWLWGKAEPAGRSAMGKAA